MRTVADVNALERGKPTIMTIGTFDGVHRGHQWLIRQVVDRARHLEYDSLVLTFDPAPQVVFRPGSTQLTDGAEKARIISALDPTVLAVLQFSLELSQIPAPAFLASILEHVDLAEIWVGADFAFGHKRQGTVDYLIGAGQENSFAVHVVPRQGLQGDPISSTRVRQLVQEGAVDRAAVLLGHFMALSGRVVSGFGRGAKLGFPTANVQLAPAQTLPGLGIYAAYLRLDGRRLPAAVSVGYNPVFGGREIVVEAYVLDFDGDLRDREVGLEFVARVREERNFESVELLVEQMGRDVEEVRRILAGG